MENQIEEEYKVVHSHQLFKELREKNKDKPRFGATLGFPGLDDATRGIREGNFIVISGENEGGKTTLAITITVNFFNQGIKSLWFSYEETEEEFFERFSEDELPLPEFYLPRKIKNMQDLNWMKQKMQEAIKEFQIKAVFIDSFGRMFYEDSDSLGTQNRIIKFLKDTALELKISIFLLSHLDKNNDGIPTKKFMRGTGKMADEADKILFIRRELKKELKKENRWRRRSEEDEEEMNEETDRTIIKWGKLRRRSKGGKKTKIYAVLVNGLLKELDYQHKFSPEEVAE